MPLASGEAQVETMLRLTAGQRRVLIDRLPELANFAVASLLFGQFLSDRPFSWGLAVGSLAVWAALLGLTFFFAAAEDA
jgi:hypothetical protein